MKLKYLVVGVAMPLLGTVLCLSACAKAEVNTEVSNSDSARTEPLQAKAAYEKQVGAAVFHENTNRLKTFLAQGADPNMLVGPIGHPFGSLLELAALKGNSDSVKLLLAYGADPNFVDKKGDTPLYMAVARGNFDIAKLLLSYWADPNLADKRGITPLYTASAIGNIAILKLLLAHGADPSLSPPPRIDKATPPLLAWFGFGTNLDPVSGTTPLSMAKGETKTLLQEALQKRRSDVYLTKEDYRERWQAKLAQEKTFQNIQQQVKLAQEGGNPVKVFWATLSALKTIPQDTPLNEYFRASCKTPGLCCT